MNNRTFILGKNIPWNTIDGEVCRVIEFIPYGKIENEQVKAMPNFPYASLIVECTKFQQKATLNITHRMDFMNLWQAFIVRTIKEDEEVLVLWSNKHYKSWLVGLFSAFMPKMWIMVCRKTAYELITNRDYNPELTGEARYLAERPIIQWKPEVMS